MNPRKLALVESLAALLADRVDPTPTPDEIAGWVETPPDPAMGDLALPCFKLAPLLRRAPAAIAVELANEIALPEGFREIRATGPYLNAFFDAARFVHDTVEQVRSAGAAYGNTDEGAGETICIDFSSPNLAKPFHVGHLCSTILGATLARMYEAKGYRVWKANHLGDWGVQVGFQILAWQRWGDSERLAAEGIGYLTDLYVRINEDAKSDPRVDDEARRIFKSLEDGDEELLRLWERFREVTLESLRRSYARLGISFDSYNGEAFCEREGLSEAVVRRFEGELGLAVRSRGALVVPLNDEDLPPLILKKSDDASIYATRDLATAIWRWERFGFAKNLYVTDQRQALHFRQLFSALDRAGFDWADRNEHIPYGLVKIVDGGRILPMSTRSGKMIRLEELLDRLVAAVRTIVEEEAVKRAELSPPEIERVSEAVGVGAVLFWTQARGRRNDLLFDWDRATDTRGATGPYLQYAHARLCGILRKHGGPVPSARGVSPLESPEELAIARRLAEFPSVLHKAAELYEPSMLAEFLLDLSSSFSTFYNKHRVLKQEDSVTSARLRLVDAIRLVLARGLTILGMTAPERM